MKKDGFGTGDRCSQHEKFAKGQAEWILNQVVVQGCNRRQRNLEIGDCKGSEHFVNVQASRTITVSAKKARLAKGKELVKTRWI